MIQIKAGTLPQTKPWALDMMGDAARTWPSPRSGVQWRPPEPAEFRDRGGAALSHPIVAAAIKIVQKIGTLVITRLFEGLRLCMQ